MQWSYYITNTSNKAKILNFLRRNLYRCSEDVKAAAHLAIVWPLMEYASVVLGSTSQCVYKHAGENTEKSWIDNRVP